MASLTATQLAPVLNAFTISTGPPRTITVPKASRLAALQDITVTGKLLKKQYVRLDPKTNKRTAALAAAGGAYVTESGDGDLHFDLGVTQLQPHIACELQNAKAWIATFNQAIGQSISVSAFFRCLFEHPGFSANDDAHIFELHPVRAVNIGGKILAFNVDVPVQTAIHTWTAPHPLNQQDGRITVKYDKAGDRLVFSGMDGRDENYVRVAGAVSSIRPSATSSAPARFTLNSPDIGHPVQVYALQGTTAVRQLSQLKSKSVSMVALRNIELSEALNGRYVISLLAIDIQPT